MNRQTPSVTQSAVAADFHQTLDVERSFTAQVTFGLDCIDLATDRIFLLVSQVLGADRFINAASGKNLLRCCRTDTIDICE